MGTQSVPIGISISSPTTWLVVAVAFVVLALAVTTRRNNMRPRSSLPGAQNQPMTLDARARYTDEWAEAQALFVEDPRAGCEFAQTIVANVMRERGFTTGSLELLDSRYRAGSAILARGGASTEDLRRAFVDFRAVFGAMLTGASPDLGR